MKWLLIGLIALSTAQARPDTASDSPRPATRPAAHQEGDIVFQTSRSAQSRAIQAATGSPWSHVGLLFRVGGQWQVLEAVQPVRFTPLDRWVARGAGGRYVTKRLRDRVLTKTEVATLRRIGEGFLGRPYDLAFGWSDTHIYCSELVYKVYQRALGVPVGQRVALGELNLDHPEVKPALAARYGTAVPLREPVVSPASQFDDPRLIEVGAGGRE